MPGAGDDAALTQLKRESNALASKGAVAALMRMSLQDLMAFTPRAVPSPNSVSPGTPSSRTFNRTVSSPWDIALETEDAISETLSPGPAMPTAALLPEEQASVDKLVGELTRAVAAGAHGPATSACMQLTAMGPVSSSPDFFTFVWRAGALLPAANLLAEFRPPQPVGRQAPWRSPVALLRQAALESTSEHRHHHAPHHDQSDPSPEAATAPTPAVDGGVMWPASALLSALAGAGLTIDETLTALRAGSEDDASAFACCLAGLFMASPANAVLYLADGRLAEFITAQLQAAAAGGSDCSPDPAMVGPFTAALFTLPSLLHAGGSAARLEFANTAPWLVELVGRDALPAPQRDFAIRALAGLLTPPPGEVIFGAPLAPPAINEGAKLLGASATPQSVLSVGATSVGGSSSGSSLSTGTGGAVRKASVTSSVPPSASAFAVGTSVRLEKRGSSPSPTPSGSASAASPGSKRSLGSTSSSLLQRNSSGPVLTGGTSSHLLAVSGKTAYSAHRATLSSQALQQQAKATVAVVAAAMAAAAPVVPSVMPRASSGAHSFGTSTTPDLSALLASPASRAAIHSLVKQGTPWAYDAAVRLLSEPVVSSPLGTTSAAIVDELLTLLEDAGGTGVARATAADALAATAAVLPKEAAVAAVTRLLALMVAPLPDGVTSPAVPVACDADLERPSGWHASRPAAAFAASMSDHDERLIVLSQLARLLSKEGAAGATARENGAQALLWVLGRREGAPALRRDVVAFGGVQGLVSLLKNTGEPIAGGIAAGALLRLIPEPSAVEVMHTLGAKAAAAALAATEGNKAADAGGLEWCARSASSLVAALQGPTTHGPGAVLRATFARRPSIMRSYGHT